MLNCEEIYYNYKKEIVKPININDLYLKFNCTTKNKKILEYLKDNVILHHWDDNFYFVIGTKKSMVKISKKKDHYIMTTY